MSTNPKQQAKLITVALAAKTPHNSEAVAIFEEDGDSEFLSQLVNSSQMQMSTHKNGSLFHITDLPKKNCFKKDSVLPNDLLTTTPIYVI